MLSRRGARSQSSLLIEDHEIVSLNVAHLGEEVRLRHMHWLHLPIADFSVPGAAFEAAWIEAGEGIRARLRDGFDIVVHCKGGLGRAGLVAARLMVELGDTAEGAITAVRAARPGAIETSAQADYVRQQSVASRTVATLEVAARDSYQPVTDMTGGGPFHLKPGEWTDDTAMALALADSLIANPRLDEADLMRRFVEWSEQGTYSCTGFCFDVGITTKDALARWKRNGDPIAGSTASESAGNGSLMRLAPVALQHRQDRKLLAEIAARQSRTTHAAPEAVDACIVYADILADAIVGRPRAGVLSPRQTSAAGKIAGVVGGSWRGKARREIRSSGYVADSLEAALWCVGRSSDFADTVLMAANLGRDADTTAAIAGQLAGALYGMRGIPPKWLDMLAWRERIEAAGRALIG
jgi:ADP-ribosyl-[dinitrogen reductase] hydrolase